MVFSSSARLGPALAVWALVVLSTSACSSRQDESQARQGSADGAQKAQVQNNEAAQARNNELPTVENHGQSLPDFTWLVKKYGGAVVNVTAVGRRSAGSSQARQMPPDDPFFEFFRRFGIEPPGDVVQQPMRALGSGFIVSKDGYVLTNAHVVDQAAEVTVRLPDRREYPAKVIGTDRPSDVAVLKINAKDLPTVTLGDPSKLEPGQWVVAIGSPFGFENSVTAGVISATSRALGPQSALVPFIQSDVAVNPGNSGGPLFNLSGEVIGINSQIYSQTGGYQGVSFAIPIDVARTVEQQLVQTGHVTRGRIGVAIQDVSAQLAQSFKLDRPRGALVAAVDETGPAAKAGVKEGDIILGVDGKPIETSGQLPSLIANTRPGTETTLELWRNGRSENVKVRAVPLEDNEARTARDNSGGDNSAHTSKLGVSVRPLTPEEQQQVDTEGRLVVEQVQDPAASAGVQPGDIIVAVGNKPVKSVEDLREAVEHSKGSVALLIQREDARLYVPVRVG